MTPGHRLGCATHILGDVVINVPADSQIHRQVVRKRTEVPDIEIDPVVRLFYVEIVRSDDSDERRLFTAIREQWDLEGLLLEPAAAAELQEALVDESTAVTVAIHDKTDITAVWPGFRDRSLGIAFDVGSTTVAGHLCDLLTGEILATHGEMNPQIRFGEDVMSRVSYAMMNDDGAKDISDGIFTLGALFTMGSQSPPATGTDSCGQDPTEDGLDCAAFESCP